MTALAFLAATAAFVLLGLISERHAPARLGIRPAEAAKRRSRIIAWSLIAVALAFAIAGRGWIFGPVVWLGSIMFAAAAAFLALNFLPVSVKANR